MYVLCIWYLDVYLTDNDVDTITRLQTLLGDDQYIFTRLNKVFDAMPASKSLTHQLFPRAPTPFDGKLAYEYMHLFKNAMKYVFYWPMYSLLNCYSSDLYTHVC